ncbi:MAG: hypothetical protein ABH887_01440 [bacterium]
MALTGEVKKISKNGIESEIFSVNFSNGTYAQLKELKGFLVKKDILKESDSLEKVVEITISLLETLKDKDKDKDKY